MEIQDLLQWLENTDLRLSSSKTMWSMPDSASERLNAHLVKRTRLLAVKTKRNAWNYPIKNSSYIKTDPLFFFSPTKGAVQWDGVKAPCLHRCEECHPQDAGEQQCCPGIEHRTQLVYSRPEMGFCLQQSSGAKGYLTLHIHVSSWWFIHRLMHNYIWASCCSHRQSLQKDWVWPKSSTVTSRSFSLRWASVKSLLGFSLLPALFWTQFVHNCRLTE